MENNNQKHLRHIKGGSITQPPLQFSKVMTFRKNDIEYPKSDKTDLYKIEFWLQYNVYVEWVWFEPDNRDEVYDLLLENLSKPIS